MDRREKHKFKRLLHELKSIRGRHTELVTVYVPTGYDIHKVITHLAQEQGTASNIKDKNTRKNVIDALDKMIRHLRLYTQTPPHGLAAFSGNASEKEGQPDIKIWSIEPPEPLSMRLYRCDQTFVLDALQDMLETSEVYGLIVLDNREGTIGTLKGSSVTTIKELHSTVPGKIKAGGQCLHSDSIVHLADGQLLPLTEVEVGDEVLSYDFSQKDFVVGTVRRIWKTVKDTLYSLDYCNETRLACSEDHIIILADGSEVSAKDLEAGMLLLDVSGKSISLQRVTAVEKEITLLDVEVSTGNLFVDSILVHNSQQRYARLREGAAKDFYVKIGEIANKEFLAMGKDLKGILVGGPGITKETFLSGHYLNQQLKDKVVGVEDLSYTGEFGLKELIDKPQSVLAQEEIVHEKQAVEKLFYLLAKEPDKVAYGVKEVDKALELGAVELLLLVDSFENSETYELHAEDTGATIVIVSHDTEYGAQVASLGGIAAILRYSLQ